MSYSYFTVFIVHVVLYNEREEGNNDILLIEFLFSVCIDLFHSI